MDIPEKETHTIAPPKTICFTECRLPGCYLVNFPNSRDHRGLFVKSFQRSAFQKHGLECDFTESFYTESGENVLRGMHFQTPPTDHSKLVYCMSGAIHDVAFSLWRRWLVPICAAISLVYLMKATWIACHWPFVHDAPIMHYVVFLMAHGFAPYRDIIDMQMPGSYLTDDLVIRLLGPGIGGEITWDILNGLVVIAAAMWIAGKRHRIAAVTCRKSRLFDASEGWGLVPW